MLLNKKYIVFFYVAIILTLFLFSIYLYKSIDYINPIIDEIWVINLNKDTERMKSVLQQERYLPHKIQRWTAAYGKEEIREDIAMNDGVQTIISRSSDANENKKSDKVLNKAGEIGCWLSHKRLLKHLIKSNYPPNFGHLICEDDIKIPANFNERWDSISKTIPGDWDMVYLGIGGPHGDHINKHVIKWKNDKKEGANFRTHAYLVRHKSIGKILDKLALMAAPIDVQYYLMLGGLNIYIVDPELISPNEDDFKSSIDEQELRFA